MLPGTGSRTCSKIISPTLIRVHWWVSECCGTALFFNCLVLVIDTAFQISLSFVFFIFATNSQKDDHDKLRRGFY